MRRIDLQEIPDIRDDAEKAEGRSTETRSLPFICEAITLPACGELVYAFELNRNERLEFTLRSDRRVDILLCKVADYERWVDSGYDPEIGLPVHLEAEDVLAYTLRFIAPQKGEYAVLLMNWTATPADLAVEVPDT
jgi:hypothetical protein